MLTWILAWWNMDVGYVNAPSWTQSCDHQAKHLLCELYKWDVCSLYKLLIMPGSVWVQSVFPLLMILTRCHALSSSDSKGSSLTVARSRDSRLLLRDLERGSGESGGSALSHRRRLCSSLRRNLKVIYHICRMSYMCRCSISFFHQEKASSSMKSFLIVIILPKFTIWIYKNNCSQFDLILHIFKFFISFLIFVNYYNVTKCWFYCYNGIFDISYYVGLNPLWIRQMFGLARLSIVIIAYPVVTSAFKA